MVYLKQYFIAIWADWVSRMSTIASVLFIFLALVFRLTEIGQARYWIAAALVAYAIASFSTWRKERIAKEQRDKVIEGLEKATDSVSLSPSQLIKLYEGRTTIQGEKLAAVYEGKWITVSGKVRDVEKHYLGGARILLDQDNGPPVFLAFAKGVSDAVSVLGKGER